MRRKSKRSMVRNKKKEEILKKIEQREKQLEARTEERVQKLRSGIGRRKFISDISYPEKDKLRNKFLVANKVEFLAKLLPEIKNCIKRFKQISVPQIWEQDAATATYLLISKAYSNLETILLLASVGKTFEIIEIARSGQEALDLAFLFQEEGQEQKLKEWYKGKIIKNQVARQAMHKAINKMGASKDNLPMYDMKSEVYWIYSLYTHSSYAALLDSVDVFHEDFDFQTISGFHYTNRNFDIAAKQLAISILLELKNASTKVRDLKNVNDVDKILVKLGNYKASPDEIAAILGRYEDSNL
jgi:hypothetical protein